MNTTQWDETPVGACTREPERWTTSADEEAKAICRACPRRWLCAREACELPRAEGLWAGIVIPKAAAAARLPCASCGPWRSATDTRFGIVASTPNPPDRVVRPPPDRGVGGVLYRIKMTKDSVKPYRPRLPR